ncbi:PTS sugar transporter subunit IIA [Mitsuokella sp. oral taxon 131]|uniref:PTS sugar transporter subunit IIA n=1 Tax=Mitsuokella sp. oral taxon 131 TaxID=1321780 RepID=UPI0004246D77|nr:PTS sugar transporter subunit IIA [Mitsuokella sp. oral taxon 131]
MMEGVKKMASRKIDGILNERLIDLDLVARNKREAIEGLVDRLYEVGNVTDREDFIKDVFEREKEGVTGIGNHIAIPHGKSDAVKATSIAVGRVKDGIPWESLDREPVRVVILFAVRNADTTNVHLKLLSEVAMALADDDTLKRLLETDDKKEIIHLLSQEMN